MSSQRFFLPIIMLLLIFVACSDSSTEPPEQTHGTIEGSALFFGTDEPMDNASVILLTEQFVILRATNTDDDGSFSFQNIEAGSLLLYVLKESFMMAEVSASQIDLQGGQTLNKTVRMVNDLAPLYNHRITGRITDATTGAAVAGAWIASTGLGEAGNSVRYLTNGSGIIIAVSDEDGNYDLPMYGVTEGDEGPVIGLSPVSIGCQGFRSRTFAGEGPDFCSDPWFPGGLLPAPADSVLVLDIALEPVPENGLPADFVGTVRGVIVHNEQPQAGVVVTMTLMALADRDTVFDPAAKVSIDGGSVVSGSDGSFEFVMEPGFYALRAGIMPNDGWCLDGGLSNLEVVAGEINDVENIWVSPAIAPVFPVSEGVFNQLPILSWTAIEGAEFYTVKAGFNSSNLHVVGTTSETELDWPIDLMPPEGTTLVWWNVYAVRNLGEIPNERFSWFEIPASFTLEN